MMSLRREKDGSRANRVHARDDNWTKFEEYARQRESVGEGSFPISSRNPLSPTSGRLHKEDMAIYGREPATDHMILTVCEACQRSVKSQAFARHKEMYHPETLKGHSVLGPVRTIGQSSSLFGGVANGSVEIKRKALDLDRHCGVWMEEEKKQCKKSISCKIHSLEQRRKVVGRSRQLSELISEYKKMKKIRKIEKLRGTPVQTNQAPPYVSPAHPPASANHIPISPMSPITPQSHGTESVMHKGSPPHSSIVNYFDDVEIEQFETNETTLDRGSATTSTVEPGVLEEDLYPKPAAVCSFGRRSTTGCGKSSLFNHRLDTFRCSLVHLAGREKDFSTVLTVPDSSIRRKYSSCLSHRTQHKKKYARLEQDQNHFSLLESPSSEPCPQPIASQSSVSTMPSTITPSTTFRTSSFYNTSRRHSQPLRSTVPTSSSITASDETSIDDQQSSSHVKQYHSKPHRRASEDQLHKGSLPPPPLFNNKQNHIMESLSFPPTMVENSEDSVPKQDEFSHLNHWTESDTTTPTNMFTSKIPAPPSVNGVINPSGSLSAGGGSGMVQPFSFNSQQTYLLNPSQQQPHLFPRGVVPIGLGVPPSNTSFPMSGQSLSTVPLLYPGDKPDQSLIHLMTQGKVSPSTAPGSSTNENTAVIDGGEFARGGTPLLSGDGSLNDVIATSDGLVEHDKVLNQHNPFGFKQYENPPHHQLSEIYFSDYSGNQSTNQCITPTTPYLLNQFGNQNSPNILSRHSSSALALQQLTAAGGLVQSSNEFPSHPLTTNTPSILPLSHSQSPNPSTIHCISPSGKQNNYLHSNQTTAGIVSPSRGSAHRTQQRVS